MQLQRDSWLSNHAREFLSFGMRVAYTGLAFIITVILARLLGPASLGKYFEVAAWILLISGAVQAGWASFLVREVAELHEKGLAARAAGVTLLSKRVVGVIGVVAALLLIATAYFTRTDAETMTVLVIAAPIIPLLAMSATLQAVTRGMGWPLLGQMSDNLARPCIQLIGLLCFVVGLVAVGLTPASAMAIFLFAVACGAGLAAWLERPASEPLRGPEAPRVPPSSEWLGSFLRNAAISWSTAVNMQIGTLVLASTASDPEIADFRISQQLALLMAIGLTAVATHSAPEISRRIARNDLPALQALATKVSYMSLAAALPIAMLYFLFGRSIIAICFGQDFAGAYEPLLILAVGQIVNAAMALATVIAVAARSEATAVRAHLIGAASNVLLCFFLVPAYGALGAAIGSSAALIAWNLLLFVHVKRKFGISSFAGTGALSTLYLALARRRKP